MFRDLPTLLVKLMLVVNYRSLMMLYTFQILSLCVAKSDEILVLAVNSTVDGRGLNSKACFECLPKETKAMPC